MQNVKMTKQGRPVRGLPVQTGICSGKTGGPTLPPDDGGGGGGIPFCYWNGQKLVCI